METVLSSEHSTNSEYNKMRYSAELEWSSQPLSGRHVGLPDGYYNLGLTVGSFFKPNETLNEFLKKLKQLKQTDSSITLIPEGCHHFTFLALASHKYKDTSNLPPEVCDLYLLCREFLEQESWQLDQLRLVPGKNYLLLAGIPTNETADLRKRFASALMSSSWASHIKERHGQNVYQFPPLIWHTTICRYQKEYLSSELRALYFDYKDINFGSVDLEPPILRAVNYDWSVTQAANNFIK